MEEGKDAPRRNAARGALSRETLAALVAEDLTVREIAARVDRSFTTVRYWLQRHGLRTTERARRRGPAKGESLGDCPTHGRTAFFGPAGQRRCARCRADAVTRWRQRTKRTLVAEAGGACVACGYDRCIAALQFHHLDPSTKRFGLATRGLARSIDVLREEAARCVLLCANCHAEVEAGVRVLEVSLGAEAAGPVRGAAVSSAVQVAGGRREPDAPGAVPIRLKVHHASTDDEDVYPVGEFLGRG